MTTYHPIDGGIASLPDDFDDDIDLAQSRVLGEFPPPIPPRPVGEVPAAASDVMARAIERITESPASFIPAVHGQSAIEKAAIALVGFYEPSRVRPTPDFWAAFGHLVRVVKEGL